MAERDLKVYRLTTSTTVFSVAYFIVNVYRKRR